MQAFSEDYSFNALSHLERTRRTVSNSPQLQNLAILQLLVCAYLTPAPLSTKVGKYNLEQADLSKAPPLDAVCI